MKDFTITQEIAVSAFLRKWDRGYTFGQLLHEMWFDYALVMPHEDFSSVKQKNLSLNIKELYLKLDSEIKSLYPKEFYPDEYRFLISKNWIKEETTETEE